VKNAFSMNARLPPHSGFERCKNGRSSMEDGLNFKSDDRTESLLWLDDRQLPGRMP
jgi:hypothetical protein